MTHYQEFGSRKLPICLVNYHCNNQHILVLCTHAGVCTQLRSVSDLNLEPCVHMCVLNLVLCVLYHCEKSNCANWVPYISASITLLYVQLSFRE
jgi:hypothetical protein